MHAEYLSHMGDDLAVVNAARVSLAKYKVDFDDTDERLIQYLAKHGHWSPFSHPQITLRISAPVFVARQWWRHQVGVARNEVSRRYVDDAPSFYRIETWRRRPADSIKQGSGADFDPHQQFAIKRKVSEAENQCRLLYDNLIAQGVAPEQARSILPQSMMTEWIETGSLAYFARACGQRLDDHAQAEVRELAEQVSVILSPLFPVSWGVLVP
jgi:thymidylate synthase (FAD)